MNKQLRIFRQNDIWHCELWIERSTIINDGYFFKDKVTASNWIDLQIEIGNKNWIDLLNK